MSTGDRRRVAAAVPLVAAAPLLAILLWWGLVGGGYDEAVWYPGALALVGLLVAVQVAGGPRRPPGRALPAALAALVAYTAWSYGSILWADSPGVALAGSHRTLAFLAAFAAMALLPWTPRTLLVALGAWVSVVTLLGVVTVLRLLGDGWGDLLIDARLAAPLGYQNADPALWTMGALPALLLASDRLTPTALRPLLMASAGFLFALPLASQSRGWLFTLPAVALVTLLVAPARMRLVLHSLPVGLAVAVTAPRLLRPYNIGGAKDLEKLGEPFLTALHQAAGATAVAAAIAGAGGVLLVLADRRIRFGRAARKRIRRAGVAMAAVAAAGAVAAAFVASDGRPLERAESAWESFQQYERPTEEGADRFSRLGSSRYDFWRVSLDVWRERPLLGAGQDNFAERYLMARESTEEPRWTHSLPLRLLAHTGLVGLLAFLAFAVLAVVAGAGVPREERRARLAVAAAATPAVVWLLHGSVDWLWEIPILSVAALGFAGAAASLGARERARAQGDRKPVWVRRGGPRAVAMAVTGLVVAVAAVSLVAALLAERNTDLATRHWRADPDLALDRLDRAASLNPLDARAPLAQGLIEHQLGRKAAAVASLRDAVERAPLDWLALFELALVRGGPEARTLLQEAQRLNPSEPLIEQALRRLGSRRPMTPEEAAQEFRERITRRVGPAASVAP